MSRLFDVTPTRRIGEPNKYNFDPVQLAEYNKEEAPEFAFTGYTLFEALLLIAEYKGSFPELKDKTVSFRLLWNGVWKTEEINSSDINQYCTYLETEVQNLVVLNNSRESTGEELTCGINYKQNVYNTNGYIIKTISWKSLDSSS